MMLPRSPQLVEDLISLILEASAHWWSRDFQRLALISTVWLVPVQRHLYQHPTLFSFSSCALLARTLVGSPYLCSLVRGVHLRPISHFHDPGQFPLSAKEATSIRYLLNLKGLESVSLSGELAVHTERFLYMMMANARTITSLRVDGSHSQGTCSPRGGNAHCSASLEWGEVLASKFPALRTLHLSNLALSIAAPTHPYYLQIEQLVLDDVVIVEGLLQDFCCGSWTSIRRLDLTIQHFTPHAFFEDLREILQSCQRLRALSYEMYGVPEVAIEDTLPPTPTLRSLELKGVDITLHSLRTIAQMFARLANLSVEGRRVQVTSKQWVDFVLSKELGSLQTLCVPYGTWSPPFTPWTQEEKDRLVIACSSCNVGLRAS